MVNIDESLNSMMSNEVEFDFGAFGIDTDTSECTDCVEVEE